MELEVTLPPKASTIEPIFITSPCNHSGGALLQRVMCSHEKGICFGDNIFDEILSLTDWAVALIDRHQGTRDVEAQVLQNVLSGSPSRWMPELAPSFELYMSSLFSVVYNLPFSLQEFARENGRDVWGLARAGIPSSRINDLLSVFPMTTAIFIHRNPIDIARDRRKDDPQSSVMDICTDWNLYMRDYLSVNQDRIIKLRYEDAVNETEAFRSTLEKAFGLEGLSSDLLSENREAELDSTAELSEEEVSRIRDQCSDMLAVYYPDLVA